MFYGILMEKKLILIRIIKSTIYGIYIGCANQGNQLINVGQNSGWSNKYYLSADYFALQWP